MNLQRILWAALVAAVLSVPASARTEQKPVEARKPSLLRTYRFTAKITHNGGVTPFKVGTMVTGEFTYDLYATNIRPDRRDVGWYNSSKHRFSFRYGKLRFVGKGDIRLSIGKIPNTVESFGIGPRDLTMPPGWKMAPRDPQLPGDVPGFRVMLQNSPPFGAIKNTSVPGKIEFWRFATSRDFRLHFSQGVAFPGGQLEARTFVYAEIKKLELVQSKQPETVRLKKRR
jgi:hypothetical protein